MIKIDLVTDEVKQKRVRKAKQICRYLGAVLFVLLYIYFWLNKDFYTLKHALFVTVICVGGVFISLFPCKLSEKNQHRISIILFILTPIVMFFALEYVNIFDMGRLPWQVLANLGKKKCVLTIGIFYLIMLVVYALFNRIKVAVVSLSAFTAVYGIICYFVYAFRGIPFLASDISIVGTAMNVMDNYDYSLAYQPFVLLLLAVLWSVMILKTKSTVKLKWPLRVPLGILCAACVGIFVYLSANVQMFKISVNTFMPQKSYGKHGEVLTFIGSIRYIMVEKPDGYSIQVAEKLAEPYQETAAEEEYVQPNVIVIMNEAFTDLQTIAEFDTNQEVLPFFNGLKENTVRGQMYVSVFGGQTANTEFEFLTGNSKAFLPASSTPYQLFIKDELPSLASQLSEQGYQGKLALHPFAANGYNRASVYPLLGFEEFISLEKFDMENAKIIRKFVSDESHYDRLIDEYESAKSNGDAPFFAFNVTMQNHSSYSEDFDNLAKDIKITDENYYSEEAERYLNLVHISDRELENLVNYFEQKDDPTVIVFFGDHQPGIQNSFYEKLFGQKRTTLTGADLMENYKVPYIIWANYDIEEQENLNTSVNYLSSIMCKSAGMELSPYNEFLLEMAKDVPVISGMGYFGDDGNYYKVDDKDSPYYDRLQEYAILQYNNMFDKGNRLEGFFD